MSRIRHRRHFNESVVDDDFDNNTVYVRSRRVYVLSEYDQYYLCITDDKGEWIDAVEDAFDEFENDPGFECMCAFRLWLTRPELDQLYRLKASQTSRGTSRQSRYNGKLTSFIDELITRAGLDCDDDGNLPDNYDCMYVDDLSRRSFSDLVRFFI